MDLVKKLLDQNPFDLDRSAKMDIFMPAIRAQAQWHYENSVHYKKICDNKGLDVSSEFGIEDLPMIPVTLFKKIDLISVPKDEVVKTLMSSGTSGSKSKVFLDAKTSSYQSIALAKIMKSFLGGTRRHFIVFDSPKTISSTNGSLSSRGSAIRGLLGMAQSVSFVLDDDLKFDISKFTDAIKKIPEGGTVCYFGFTWLMHTVFESSQTEINKLANSQDIDDAVVLHIGGWKKLAEKSISKGQFNTNLANIFRIEKGKIIDFYGMTEQLGTVYPDTEHGDKVTPAYSEIIIRDTQTFEVLPPGETGFIQLVSPIPHSYPGISIISDDLGKIHGYDDSPCGRLGTRFTFEKRSDNADLKGCGDTLPV